MQPFVCNVALLVSSPTAQQLPSIYMHFLVGDKTRTACLVRVMHTHIFAECPDVAQIPEDASK
eukprot:m.545559 g.545559  ORF g.545559 m.545559 type:complete len:63 (+) comp22147_c0_seq17:1908-2096(+)